MTRVLLTPTIGSTLVLIALSACQSVPVDSSGAIPSDAAVQVDAFAGTYQGALVIKGTPSGSINPIGPSFQISVYRDGNRPLVTAATDVLGAGCGSKIGKLLSLEVGGPWDVVAEFEFDPGQCADAADGRSVDLRLDRNGEALFTLHKATVTSGAHHSPDEQDYSSDMKRL